MLQTQALTFAYNNQNTFQFPDVYAHKKEPLLIIGESGTGKTTLLHLLAGLLKSNSGEIIINNQNIAKLSKSKTDEFRGKNIGIVYQSAHFVKSLTVKQNLQLAAKLGGSKINDTEIQKLATALGIETLLNKMTNNLSIGEQQRASIARSLINKPSILLADEPTSSLDDSNCEKVIELLKQQSIEHHTALIVVTHDSRLKSQFKNQITIRK